MEDSSNEYLDLELESTPTVSRRELLPWWMKVFIWIFMIFGILAPIGLVFGFMGSTYGLAFYGLETNQPFSIIGIIVLAVYLLKGVTAFALWAETDIAINLGLIDAVIGIVICTAVMFVFPFIDDQPGFQLSFRLELALLIIYLIKLQKIRPEWKKG